MRQARDTKSRRARSACDTATHPATRPGARPRHGQLPSHDTAHALSAGRAAGAPARAATRQPGAYHTAGPGHDKAGPRATIWPLCEPGCACVRLGVPSLASLGVLCT